MLVLLQLGNLLLQLALFLRAEHAGLIGDLVLEGGSALRHRSGLGGEGRPRTDRGAA